MNPPATGKGAVIAVATLAFLFVIVYATGPATLVVGAIFIGLVAVVLYYLGVNIDRILRELF